MDKYFAMHGSPDFHPSKKNPAPNYGNNYNTPHISGKKTNKEPLNSQINSQ